ncbi:P-loop containing nucleoside triphosphate hydrolases superfamily protein [Perilla frutescens var. hirtella]|nr:P-loop containing nucleoside triphosphate hydrolases superfamily protein [Perilla frutescens var. hirtella]
MKLSFSHSGGRPELFSYGNLLKPCKGILPFGPPGTGRTLIVKALATESGANFINITTATITSMWCRVTENLTRAVFSYARKLTPAIIFVDEVDCLVGAHGHDHEKDTSRLNEFMAAWDGLKSKESRRILVIGATNRHLI